MIVGNTVNVFVDCSPWTSLGYRISYLHLYEALGGKVPFGEVELWLDSSADTSMITEKLTGTITVRNRKNGGIEYEIPFFITSRAFFKNVLKLTFVCISDIKFLEVPISTEFEDITDALNSLYPGKKDIRTKSDIDNNIKIYQACETNYGICTKLAYAFRHNIVFAYSWDSFVLKELCGQSNSFGKEDPSISLSGLSLMFNTSPYELAYNKFLKYDPYNPWEDTENSTTQDDYTDKEFLNCRCLVNYTSFSIQGVDYYQLHENYSYNKNLMDAKLYSTFTLTGQDFPGYKIGDVISFSRPDQTSSYPFEKFIVATNELFYATEVSDRLSPHGLRFEWTSTLYGLDEGKWTTLEEAENA